MFTSIFSHGSWFHLLGNMWFLWIFGNNIEDAMGHARFLGFFILTGLIAAFAHVFMAPDSNLPMVGASGAVSGIMGSYLVLFPKARIRTLFLFVFILRVIPMPAWVFLGLWTAMQFLGFAVEGLLPESGGVAYAAHIGGLCSGLVLIFFFRKRRTGTAEILDVRDLS